MLWIALIVVFSGDTLGFGRTAAFIGWVMRKLGFEVTTPTLYLLNTAVRKAVHVITYGVLSLLVFRALRDGERGWRLSWVMLAIAITIGVASVDEYRQTFYASRTGTIVDLLYDTAGALLAQLLIWWRLREQPGIPIRAGAE